MKKYYVSLEDILKARDRRAENQREMLAGLDSAEANAALISFTLNIPGEYKRTPFTALLFQRGLKEIEAFNFDEKERRFFDDITGTEALILVREKPQRVKKLLEDIEDSFPAARLFDLDVMDAGGEKLSRRSPRKCLLCQRPAHECARSRAHGLESVKEKVNKLLRDFAAEELMAMAVSSLKDELYTTPKPGLVDLDNNGAHSDMDIPLFEKSIDSISPYFKDVALLGIKGTKEETREMADLKKLGFRAEEEMFNVTQGVNTHKGIIYSMGLLIFGMARSLVLGGASEVDLASGLAKVDCENRLREAKNNPATNGAKVYSRYGASGAVGEAVDGFRSAVKCGEDISRYMESLNESRSSSGENLKLAGAFALMDSMANLDDTNLIHRGGLEGLNFVKEEAKKISELPIRDSEIEEKLIQIRALDNEMIKRNLSPGGSADILALGYLLYRWKEKKELLFKSFDERGTV